jgi:hypothetical protein
MSTTASAIDMTAAREVYQLLEGLEGHVSDKDSSGRAKLYQAKERIRKLIIDMDRSSVKIE